MYADCLIFCRLINGYSESGNCDPTGINPTNISILGFRNGIQLFVSDMGTWEGHDRGYFGRFYFPKFSTEPKTPN